MQCHLSGSVVAEVTQDQLLSNTLVVSLDYRDYTTAQGSRYKTHKWRKFDVGLELESLQSACSKKHTPELQKSQEGQLFTVSKNLKKKYNL